MSIQKLHCTHCGAFRCAAEQATTIHRKDFIMATTQNIKRVWMITGASRGIGARISEAALAHGDAVVATARDAASITKRFGANDNLLPVALDVTDEAQAARAVEAAIARFGRIDVLVNNAGF